jgi:hypothetical protein
MSEVAQFKQYVQMTLEQRLAKMPNLGYDGEEPSIAIAFITFAFRNA